MKRVKLILLTLCLLPSLLGAQEVTGASFLDIVPDAQSAGMGGTGLGIINNGSTAIFHNVSTIAFAQEVMGATYSYADIDKYSRLHSASLFYRIGRQGLQGVSLGFRHLKESDIYEANSSNIGNFRPYAWSLEAGYFRKIAQKLSLSLTLKYLQAKAHLNAGSKNTACIDLGATYHQNLSLLSEMSSWTIGFQVANLGGKLDGQKLPARLGLGSALNLPFSMEHSLQIAVDFNYLLPSEYKHLEAGVGAEYRFMKYCITRAGYHFGDKDKGMGNYGTLGCGISFWPICADFSYALADSESLMHRNWQISLGIVF